MKWLSSSVMGRFVLRKSTRISSSIQFILAIEQFADMLLAGIDIKDTLVTLNQDNYRRNRELAAAVSACLESGTSLSNAFRSFIDETSLTILVATESSGHFADGLRDYAKRLISRREWRERLTRALAYPSVLLAMCYGLTIFVRLDVDPTLKRLQMTLPSSNHEMGFIGTIAINFPLGLIAAMTLAPFVYAACAILRTKVPAISMKLPFDKLARSMRSELFAYRLYLQLRAGISVVDALSIENDTSTRATWLVADLTSMRTAILEGRQFAFALPIGHDPILQTLAAVGERTGDLAGSMERAADLLQTRIATSFDRLSRALEPMITCLLGLVVGSTVYSVFGPMYQTISQIGSGK